jgi:MFS transporter, SP family, sugar:H+ symporter
MACHPNRPFRRIRWCALWVGVFHWDLTMKKHPLMLYRYDTGTIGGILAMPYWEDLFSTGYRDSTGHLNVDSSQSAAIVSILSAGTFFGALSAAPIADFIGRRLGLIACSVVFIFGVILQTVATAIPLFLAGRFFAGLGLGMISSISK